MTLPKPNESHIRLFVQDSLAEGAFVQLSVDDVHYIAQVMRQKTGDSFLLFNGRDGEWLARIETLAKKEMGVRVEKQVRLQRIETDIWLCFAPPRGGRLETIIEKATELGVSKLCPILMQRSVVNKINVARLRACAKEAAEQCERLTLPDIKDITPLKQGLLEWDAKRVLFVCDETCVGDSVSAVLSAYQKQPAAFLIGPEGGYTEEELRVLSTFSFVKRISLGPRILRVDTASIAALVCWQSIVGDWKGRYTTLL